MGLFYLLCCLTGKSEGKKKKAGETIVEENPGTLLNDR
jgi:hypothetical protein